jgi:hypothetical protein
VCGTGQVCPSGGRLAPRPRSRTRRVRRAGARGLAEHPRRARTGGGAAERPCAVGMYPCAAASRGVSRVLRGACPMIYTGNCPVARAAVNPFSRILAGKRASTYSAPAGSFEDPAARSPPPGMLPGVPWERVREAASSCPVHPALVRATPCGCATGGEKSSGLPAPCRTAPAPSRCSSPHPVRAASPGPPGRDGLPKDTPAQYRRCWIGTMCGAAQVSRCASGRHMWAGVPALFRGRGRSPGGFTGAFPYGAVASHLVRASLGTCLE